MEQYPEIDAYQLSRDDGGHNDCEKISTTSKGPECSDTIRQYVSLPIHKSSGWDTIGSIVQSHSSTVAACSEESNFSKSCSHYGEEECLSGCPEQREGKGDGMVFEQHNSFEDFQSLGSAKYRSICNSPKQEDSSILFMDSPPSSVCFGCPVNCMAEHVCLCLSATPVDSQSTESFSEFQMHNDLNRTSVATPTLLCPVVESVDSEPVETTMQSAASDSEQGQDLASSSRNASVDCMAVIDRGFSSKGFSKETRDLLSKSWRKGTQKDYKCKFRKFDCWCRAKQIDPYIASLTDCADFLTHLYRKGLKYRTINGYRSMLSSVLSPVENIPVGQHPFIIRLLRAVFNERPPVKRIAPDWDLFVVLGCLKKAPFEPLKLASLKYLTWKTCFLLAITTFRRCSDLQSLELGEGFVNVNKHGVTFMRTGLSKQDRPSHFGKNIFVPAFPNNKLLDPKRALAYYLKRTETFRKAGSEDIVKLFLARKKPHQPVSAQTISRWLVEVIKYCYKKENKNVGKVKGHSTRSVGPSWALFKGASLQQIMEAADWSRETTFTQYYLKSVNVDFMKE